MTELIELEVRKNIDNSKIILKLLKKVGKIDKTASYDFLIDLLNHKTKDVRIEAIKHLGKFQGDHIEKVLVEKYKNEKDSLAKRECVSSLGRQRNKELIPFFKDVLGQKDPKIVLQGIRALLIFKKNENVINILNKIKNHPNEMVQDVLSVEFEKKPPKSKEKHSNVDKRLKNTVVNGDVLDVLNKVKNESFHLTFTSPPYYNARDYSFYSSY